MGLDMKIDSSSFTKPKRLEIEKETLTGTYGKFISEPFERGYGTTIGNSMRRVLLSSIPGWAVTDVRIDGVDLEFTALPGVKEDIADIILSIKQLQLRIHGDKPRTVRLEATGPRVLTAGDIKREAHVDVLNPDLHIATLNSDGKLKMEMTVKMGRGYWPAERNKEEEQPFGVIPVDAIFSPIQRVNYHVENVRVGQATDYDRLIMEVWTNGSISPEDAIAHAGRILRDHLSIFVGAEEGFEAESADEDRLRESLLNNLDRGVNELERSVRAANCLKNVELKTIRDLVQKTEAEMLKTKNFGRKSLNEIKELLEEMGLHLGMKLEELQPEKGKRGRPSESQQKD
jgi:DNA-directed RNA polymerase subunit alpha